jgi:hypothetical protein
MPQKQLEVSAAVARAFAKDMRAYFAAPNAVKRDEIAARQAWALGEHLPGKKLRTDEVVELFWAMKDYA